MITINKTTETGLETISEPINNSWINVVDPTAAEIAQLQDILCVPQDFLTYPLDLGELPRTERENGAMLIVLRVPHFQGETADIAYITVPLGIILTDRIIATVSRIETSVIQGIAGGRLRGVSTAKRNRLILQILLVTANRYLNDLREVNRRVDVLEDRLQSSLRNKELMDMLKYQKSLVYFATALKANEVMLQHLQRSQLFQQFPEDQDLLEDVLTEVQQAIEMTNISSSILSQMMGTFAAIISNNVNLVMKVLASITIIVSFPTMIASFYGMNVNLPLQEHGYAFLIVLGVALIVSTMVVLTLWRKDWL